MDNHTNTCHDLKTERADIGQPLPGILSFLPILFYLAVVGAIALNVWFFLQLKGSEKAAANWKSKAEDEEQLKQQLTTKLEKIKSEEKRANDVRDWVEGSRQLQPLALAVAKSMGPKSYIAELSLFRELANPDQVRIGLKFDGGGATQLESTLLSINELHYRSYSASQTAGKGGTLDYGATLIWRNPKNNESISLNNQQ